MNLEQLGWNKGWKQKFTEIARPGQMPARVVREEKNLYVIYTETGVLRARISGAYLHRAQGRKDFPAVGDWVSVGSVDEGSKGVIYSFLPRKSYFVRKPSISGGRKVRRIGNRQMTVGGTTDEQVVAANIDTAFLITSLGNDDLSLRRIERYLILCKSGGVNPVIVLNKADLCTDVGAAFDTVRTIAPNVPIHTTCALDGLGIDVLEPYVQEGQTIALLGSSGVGKSTITNRLLGDESVLTGDVRESDGKGRHTTTWRELILLPTGGVLTDTPGMRELQLWAEEDDLSVMFTDIEEIASKCKFRNCTHHTEPGCAIRQAIAKGELDKERYESYLQLKAEVCYLNARQKAKENQSRKQKAKRKPRKQERTENDWEGLPNVRT